MGLTDLFIIVFGLVIGSFLNVCIHRIPRGESVVFPASRCPSCGTSIRPWQNLPVVGFLLLRGRCGFCRAPISRVHPAVEILTAGLIYLLYLKYGLTAPLFLNALFFCLLVVLIFIDLFERILPDVITLGGALAGLILSPLQSPEFFAAFTSGAAGLNWLHYLGSLLGILTGGGILWLVAVLYVKVRKVEGLGFGDIKMMAMVGAFLGWQFAWLTIFLGSVVGAVAGSIYIYASRKTTGYELPFGSFLGGGAVIATLWGPLLLYWYFGLLD